MPTNELLTAITYSSQEMQVLCEGVWMLVAFCTFFTFCLIVFLIARWLWQFMDF